MIRLSLIVAAVLALTVFNTPSFAKPVGNHTASRLMSICLLNGGKTSEPEGRGSYVKCCTKAGAFCIICRQDGTGLCRKTAYSSRPSKRLQTPAPAPGVIAPVRAGDHRLSATSSRTVFGR